MLSDRTYCPACTCAVASQRRVTPCAPFVRTRGDWPEQTVCYRCNDCGTVWAGVNPGPREHVALYEDYRGRTYNAMRIAYEPTYDPDAVERAATDPERAGRVAEACRAHVSLATHLKALDYGGDGSLLPEELERHAYDLTGDAAPGVMPVYDGAIGDCFYDIVTCLHLLEHVRDPDLVLARLHRALKPGGMLIVEVPMAGPVLAGEWPRRVHEHLQWFTPNGLDGMVREAGFSVESADTYHGPLGVCRWVEGRAR